MMMKMGWTEGQGLGKDGQGMRTPLVVKKTDSATAIIVHAPAKRTHPLPPPQPSAVAVAASASTTRLSARPYGHSAALVSWRTA